MRNTRPRKASQPPPNDDASGKNVIDLTRIDNEWANIPRRQRGDTPEDARVFLSTPMECEAVGKQPEIDHFFPDSMSESHSDPVQRFRVDAWATKVRGRYY